MTNPSFRCTSKAVISIGRITVFLDWDVVVWCSSSLSPPRRLPEIEGGSVFILWVLATAAAMVLVAWALGGRDGWKGSASSALLFLFLASATASCETSSVSPTGQ